MFVRLAYFPGGTRAHLDAVAAQMSEHAAPEGRLLLASGPVPGGWQVVQVWRSKEELDAFNRAVFLPALARAAGRAFPAPPQVVDLVPDDVAWGAGADPES